MFVSEFHETKGSSEGRRSPALRTKMSGQGCIWATTEMVSSEQGEKGFVEN
jgi:hypothetical protein